MDPRHVMSQSYEQSVLTRARKRRSIFYRYRQLKEPGIQLIQTDGPYKPLFNVEYVFYTRISRVQFDHKIRNK